MAKTRKELDAMLEQLKAKLPQLMKDADEGSFMEPFAGQADVIEDAAGPADVAHVRGRIDCMLSSRGLIPGENEGEPCA